MSRIEWTEKTWNPTIGCTKISAGCKNCYAEVMAKRLRAMGNNDYVDGFRFKMLPSRLRYPHTIKKPTVFFVNSMSDLFHEEVAEIFLNQVFEVMQQTPRHQYQILTKRAQTMLRYCLDKAIPNNALLGVSVENKTALSRLRYLRQIDCKRFLSIEPLLGDLGELDLAGIDWVIVGGESGHNARRMYKDWAINIKNQCEMQGVPFFFKQWGAYGEDGVKRSKKQNGRLLLGKTWNQILITH